MTMCSIRSEWCYRHWHHDLLHGSFAGHSAKCAGWLA